MKKVEVQGNREEAVVESVLVVMNGISMEAIMYEDNTCAIEFEDNVEYMAFETTGETVCEDFQEKVSYLKDYILENSQNTKEEIDEVIDEQLAEALTQLKDWEKSMKVEELKEEFMKKIEFYKEDLVERGVVHEVLYIIKLISEASEIEDFNNINENMEHYLDMDRINFN